MRAARSMSGLAVVIPCPSVHETCPVQVACWSGRGCTRRGRTPARGTHPRRRPTPHTQPPRDRINPAGGGTVPVMPIPRRYSTDAIVLSRFDLGEADRVLTLITPTGGTHKAIAKGIRRPTSRLGGGLEPLAELKLVLARRGICVVVTAARLGDAELHLLDA